MAKRVGLVLMVLVVIVKEGAMVKPAVVPVQLGPKVLIFKILLAEA